MQTPVYVFTFPNKQQSILQAQIVVLISKSDQANHTLKKDFMKIKTSFTELANVQITNCKPLYIGVTFNIYIKYNSGSTFKLKNMIGNNPWVYNSGRINCNIF